jgi:hypothetical protein
MKPKISIKRAKALSEYKYQTIVGYHGNTCDKNGNNDIYESPRLKRLKNACGFCQRWSSNAMRVVELYNTSCECGQCEFAKAMGTYCTDESSAKRRKNLYMQWAYVNTHNTTKATRLARRILKLIQSIPEIEPK